MATPVTNYKLYNFAWNISTNISTLGQRTHLKLELSPLSIIYNTLLAKKFGLENFGRLIFGHFFLHFGQFSDKNLGLCAETCLR